MLYPPALFLFHSTLVGLLGLSMMAQVQNPTTEFPVVSTACHYTVLEKYKGNAAMSPRRKAMISASF